MSGVHAMHSVAMDGSHFQQTISGYEISNVDGCWLASFIGFNVFELKSH